MTTSRRQIELAVPLLPDALIEVLRRKSDPQPSLRAVIIPHRSTAVANEAAADRQDRHIATIAQHGVTAQI